MTYISLNITNKCNKACPYCINKEYVNKPHYPDRMGFDDLRKWLDELEGEVIAEIPGTGEPTLCEWLPDLLRYLDGRGIHAVLRTNGFRLGEWRLEYDRLLVIVSRHDSGDEYIKERARYLKGWDIMINAVSEDKRQKGVHSNFENDELSPHRSHGIDTSYIVSPGGDIRFMPCFPIEYGTVWSHGSDRFICPTRECPFMLGIWNMIEYLKKPFNFNSNNYTRIDELMSKNNRQETWKQ